MAEIVYMYQKTRREFGRHPEFQDSEIELLIDTHPNPSLQSQFVRQDPYETEIQCVSELSESQTNTERIMLKPQGMVHLEGGWPAGVDPTEIENKIKYTKKAEREEGYINACKALVDPTERYIKQNNAIDIYEEYFHDTNIDHSTEPPSAKTITVFTDPSPIKRTAAHLSWLSDGKKLAVAYCVMKFQGNTEGMSLKSHIWDITNPNVPEMDLVPNSPLCCLEYNPKDAHLIAGGSYNGVVQYWDTRHPTTPVMRSNIEDSHKDPVYDLRWLMSKSGEVLTVSTDGRVLIWDIKKMDKPLENEIVVLQPKNNEGGPKGILGGVSLDYDPLVGGPSKYMVGTEQGTTLSCNRRGKSPTDKISASFNGHHGPVYSVMRNTFFSKYFLTVGDWTARIWMDEIRTPMFMTYYHKAYLTCGTWHPVRPGVFLTTRMDGTMDVWDLLFKQNDPVLSVQVSDYSLHTLKVQQDGRFVAVGSVDGSTNLLELSPGLAEIARDEKNIIGQMFDRESARDKNLIQRMREAKQRKRKSSANIRAERDIGNIDEASLKELADQYLKEVKTTEEADTQRRIEEQARRRRLQETLEADDSALLQFKDETAEQ
eukprot:TRINITY_DN30588_c0_g1_i1.p1 TRINITY_DN30588_c0_g1~~TRINITY_DN30588_c0_g1_i1.p1  ORF type:complete len:598 (+),score=104.14 TRINITY_DN30588_c0_g1_i1:125-1918(+)